MGQELVAHNGHGSKPIVSSYQDESAEVAGILDEISTLLSDGTPPQEIAILARTNSQLATAEKALRHANLPYQVRNTEKFFDRKEIRDFLAQVRKASVIPSDGWIDELRTLAQPYLTGDAIDGIAALLHLARELDGDPTFEPKTLRTYLREVEDRVQQNNPPTMPVLTLATLHAAKGLEWERVFLMGASDGQLPLAGSDRDEERRLFYVGITRAKADLHISYQRTPSPFLRESGLIPA